MSIRYSFTNFTQNRNRHLFGGGKFLISLRTAEVLRRPKSLAYLQSLKWVAQVKDRVR